MIDTKPDIFPEKVDLSSPSASNPQKADPGPKDAASLQNEEKANEGGADNSKYNP